MTLSQKEEDLIDQKLFPEFPVKQARMLAIGLDYLSDIINGEYQAHGYARINSIIRLALAYTDCQTWDDFSKLKPQAFQKLDPEIKKAAETLKQNANIKGQIIYESSIKEL